MGKGEIRSHIKGLVVLTKLVYLGFICCFLLSPCLWCLWSGGSWRGRVRSVLTWQGCLLLGCILSQAFVSWRTSASLKGNVYLFSSFSIIRNYFTLNCRFYSPTVLQQNVPSRTLISFTGEAGRQTGLAVPAGSVKLVVPKKPFSPAV